MKIVKQRSKLVIFVLTMLFVFSVALETYMSAFIYVLVSSLGLVIAIRFENSDLVKMVKVPLISFILISSGLLLISGVLSLNNFLYAKVGAGISILEILFYNLLLFTGWVSSYGIFQSTFGSDKDSLVDVTGQLFYSMTSMVLGILLLSSTLFAGQVSSLSVYSQLKEVLNLFLINDSVLGSIILIPLSYLLLSLALENAELRKIESLREHELYANLVERREWFNILFVVVLPLLLLSFHVFDLQIISNLRGITLSIFSLSELKFGLTGISLVSFAVVMGCKVRSNGFSLFKDYFKQFSPYIIVLLVLSGVIHLISISQFLELSMFLESFIAELPFIQDQVVSSVSDSGFKALLIVGLGVAGFSILPVLLISFLIGLLLFFDLLPEKNISETVTSSSILVLGVFSVFAGLNPLIFFASVALTLIIWSTAVNQSEIEKDFENYTSSNFKSEGIKLSSSLLFGTASVISVFYLTRIDLSIISNVPDLAVITILLSLMAVLWSKDKN